MRDEGSRVLLSPEIEALIQEVLEASGGSKPSYSAPRPLIPWPTASPR